MKNPITILLLSLSAIFAGGCATDNEESEERLNGIEWLERFNSKYSYTSSTMRLPLNFKYRELESRNWKDSSGRAISLLEKKYFKIKTEGFPNVAVFRYGNSKSGETSCVDFYATSAEDKNSLKDATFHLICHDDKIPCIKTKVTLKEDDGRVHFNINGSFIDNKTKKVRWYSYSYELNPAWQMMESMSHFISPP